MGYFRDNVERANGYEPGFQPKQMDVVKLNTNENPYPPSPAAMKVLAQMDVEKVKADREQLTEKLRALKFEVSNSYANFVLAESKNCKASEIYDKLVQRNIYIRYFDVPGLSDKLRITVGTKEQNETLLSALEQILSE